MLSRAATRPRRQNAPRPAWKAADAFRKWLRGRPCACEGRNPDCGGTMVAAHVDYAGKGTPDAKGTGTKAADRFCIPLSDECHKLQHAKGWPWFDIQVLRRAGAGETLAAAYWQAWPGRRAWEDRVNG